MEEIQTPEPIVETSPETVMDSGQEVPTEPDATKKAASSGGSFWKNREENLEWYERHTPQYWQEFYRTALILEMIDERFSATEGSPCIGYTSQQKYLSRMMALFSALDRDDLVFLPKELSLASLHRGMSIEQLVGQWRGNLFDASKGRMPAGNISSPAFYLIPSIGMAKEYLMHAVGLGVALRVRAHAKIVVVPLFKKDLNSSVVWRSLTLAQRNHAPVAFVVLDGDGSAIARASGIRGQECGADSFLISLKKLRNQISYARTKQEPIVLSFSDSYLSQVSPREAVEAYLRKRGATIPENLRSEVAQEIDYGIERALMIPIPSKSTVVQDVREHLSPELEEQWRNWREAHGK